jgi:enterochelin esterase-like enzyme
MNNKLLLVFSWLLVFSLGCKKKVKQREDQVYSRHLQRQVKLTVLATPDQDNKNGLNLLLLNDGQDMDQFRVKEITDSLYAKKSIEPLLIVGIHAGPRNSEYGVSDMPDFMKNGDKAGYYASFIDDELYAFVKKNAGVRKFKSVVIAGCSLGGLSAFDIAWDHADKIDKVGVFSGSFWVRDKDAADPGYSDLKDRIILNKIQSSKKKPHLQYWFYAGDKEEEGDRDKDGIIDAVDDTRDLVDLLKNKHVCPPGDINFTESPEGKHDYQTWSKQLPAFLIWAFGK